MLLGKYNYIGIDTSPEYITISKHRIIAAISSIDTDKHKEASKDKDIDTQYFFDNI